MLEPNKLHTPKWLKYLLILEIVFASLGFLLTFITFFFTYFGTKSPSSSFPIEVGLVFLVIGMMPWMTVSFYTKILAKSWNQTFIKYKVENVIAFIISLITGIALTSYQYYVGLSQELKLDEKLGSTFQLLWANIFWNLITISILTFIFFGLLYGLIVLYSNFKKSTSVPWWNFIYLPGSIYFVLILLAQIPAYNSGNYIFSTIFNKIFGEQVLRFGFLSIPLIFLVFLILEYREVRREENDKTNK